LSYNDGMMTSEDEYNDDDNNNNGLSLTWFIANMTYSRTCEIQPLVKVSAPASAQSLRHL